MKAAQIKKDYPRFIFKKSDVVIEQVIGEIRMRTLNQEELSIKPAIGYRLKDIDGNYITIGETKNPVIEVLPVKSGNPFRQKGGRFGKKIENVQATPVVISEFNKNHDKSGKFTFAYGISSTDPTDKQCVRIYNGKLKELDAAIPDNYICTDGWKLFSDDGIEGWSPGDVKDIDKKLPALDDRVFKDNRFTGEWGVRIDLMTSMQDVKDGKTMNKDEIMTRFKTTLEAKRDSYVLSEKNLKDYNLAIDSGAEFTVYRRGEWGNRAREKGIFFTPNKAYADTYEGKLQTSKFKLTPNEIYHSANLDSAYQTILGRERPRRRNGYADGQRVQELWRAERVLHTELKRQGYKALDYDRPTLDNSYGERATYLGFSGPKEFVVWDAKTIGTGKASVVISEFNQNHDKLGMFAHSNGWKASGTEEEAKQFASKSAVQETIYHGTSPEAAASIAKNGFNLEKKAGIKSNFPGVVMFVNKKDSANWYAESFGRQGGNGKIMSFKINGKAKDFDIAGFNSALDAAGVKGGYGGPYVSGHSPKYLKTMKSFLANEFKTADIILLKPDSSTVMYLTNDKTNVMNFRLENSYVGRRR